MTGRKQHSRVGDIPMNIPPKIFREHSIWNCKWWMKAFDAICCNILSQTSHCNGLIESDEMVYQANLGGPAVCKTNPMQVLSVVGHQDQFMTVIIITSSNVIGGHMEQ